MFGEKQVLISGTIAWVRKYGKDRLRITLKDYDCAEGIFYDKVTDKKPPLKIRGQKVEILEA